MALVTCPKCHRQVGDFAKNCIYCNEPLGKLSKAPKYPKLNALLFVVVVMAVVAVFIVAAMLYSDGAKENETRSFTNQMQQDPGTWTEEQKNRYDDFVKWEENNSK